MVETGSGRQMRVWTRNVVGRVSLASEPAGTRE